MRKPNTIAAQHEDTASILTWLTAYPHMRKNARLWFANQRFSEAELQAVADAGLVDVAAALGWQPSPLVAKTPVYTLHKQHISDVEIAA